MTEHDTFYGLLVQLEEAKRSEAAAVKERDAGMSGSLLFKHVMEGS